VRPLHLATALLLAIPAAARSQTVEITPVAGYRFGGGFTSASGVEPAGESFDLEVEDAASFGVHVGVRVARDAEIELLYARQGTRVGTGGLFTGEPLFDLALETWQAGGNYLFGAEGSRVRPYVGAGLGITRLLPEPAGLQDETRFSASFAAGVKVWLGRHVGLRFEARGFFTVLGDDGDVFCGTRGECLVAAEDGDISQADLRAGLVLRF
jgi:hypothetical protein